MDREADLTPTQRDAFAENEADFARLERKTEQARRHARKRLEDSGYEPGGPLWCMRCTCSSYVDDDNEPSICARDYCRHSDMSHA